MYRDEAHRKRNETIRNAIRDFTNNASPAQARQHLVGASIYNEDGSVAIKEKDYVGVGPRSPFNS